MIIKATDLVSAIDILSMVPQRAGVAQSEFIRLKSNGKALRLFLASEASATAKLKPTDGDCPEFDFFIGRTLLIPFVSVARGSAKGEFSFEVKADRLIIKQGRRRASYSNTQSVPDYTDASVPMEGEKSGKFTAEQIKALQLVAKYPDATNMQPHIQVIGVSKKHGALMATDRHTLIMVQCEDLPFNSPLPPIIAGVLTEDSTVYVSKVGVRVDFQNASFYQALSEYAVKDFPYDSIVKAFESVTSLPLLAEFPVSRTSDMIGRLKSYISNLINEDTALAITAKAGKPILTCKVKSTFSAFTEGVKLPVNFAQDVDTEVKLTAVPDFFSALPPEANVKLHGDAGKPIYFVCPKVKTHLIASAVK